MDKITWLKPKVVAEFAFTEWTTEGLLRHARSWMYNRMSKLALFDANE